MGIPGLVTGTENIPRTALLQIIGNGAVPQQAALALGLLARCARQDPAPAPAGTKADTRVRRSVPGARPAPDLTRVREKSADGPGPGRQASRVRPLTGQRSPAPTAAARDPRSSRLPGNREDRR